MASLSPERTRTFATPHSSPNRHDSLNSPTVSSLTRSLTFGSSPTPSISIVPPVHLDNLRKDGAINFGPPINASTFSLSQRNVRDQQHLSPPLHSTEPNDLLSVSICDPLSEEMKQCIIYTLWNCPLTLVDYTQIDNGDMTGSYFKYYQQECDPKVLKIPRSGPPPSRRSSFSTFAPSSQPTPLHYSGPQLVSVNTHRDLMDVISILSNNRQSTRNEICEKVEERFPAATRAQTNHSIDLALRIWAMVNIQHSDPEIVEVNTTILSWGQHTLENYISSLFPRPATDYSNSMSKMEDVVFPPRFNLYMMNKIAGIKIHWTTNLADHLLYNLDQRIVKVFHVTSFLQAHSKGPAPTPDSPPSGEITSLISVDILCEALDTIGLLFPCWDANSLSYLHSEQVREKLDRHILQLMVDSSKASGSYKYWGPRLLFLHKAFEAAQPRGISQLWEDDRNKMQWYTFWIAVVVLVLTVVYGTIGVLLSAMQVWLTWKQSMR